MARFALFSRTRKRALSGGRVVGGRRRATDGLVPMAQRNSLVAAIGDSITFANSGTNDSALARLRNTSGNVGAYLTWACIVPKSGASAGDGRLRWGRTHATTNLKVAAIRTNHLPSAMRSDRYKATFVCILGGTNDYPDISPAGSVLAGPLAAVVADYRAMCVALIANGQIPVICSVTPTTIVNNQPAVAALNAEYFALSEELGVPFADFNAAVATGVAWDAGMNADGIHPSVAGAKAMGIALRDALEDWLPATPTPALFTTVTETDSSRLWRNASLTNETAELPHGGDPNTAESATAWVYTSNSSTLTTAARAGYSGQAARINKTAAGAGASELRSTPTEPVAITVAEGDHVGFGFRAEVASQTAGAVAEWLSYKATDAAVKHTQLTLNTGDTTVIDPFEWYAEAQIPSGFGTTGRLLMQGTTQAIDFYTGQVTVRLASAAADNVVTEAGVTVTEGGVTVTSS